MRLFNLIEEHHGVGLSPDSLRELPSSVVANVPRGGAHQACDGVRLCVGTREEVSAPGLHVAYVAAREGPTSMYSLMSRRIIARSEP